MEKEIFMSYASHRAIRDFTHEMLACIGIDELEQLIEKAKSNDDKYVSLTTWYIDTILKRRNQK